MLSSDADPGIAKEMMMTNEATTGPSTMPAASRRGSTMIPALRYADADAALRWLGDAFGFEEHAVHRNPAGTVVHAEMTWMTGMVMVGSGGGEPTGNATTGIYLVTDDIDAHRARAVAAGADADPIQDTDYGSREYGVRDVEGHHWHVGTYDPWTS
jgi:uncharacterized glyoxalase superfamily protein PhnB